MHEHVSSWSKGMITAIYKSGDKSDSSNYRGICVSNSPSWIKDHTISYKERNLPHPSQIGFLPGFCISDRIFSLRTIIDKNVTQTPKGKLFCCFIDFHLKKAFDSVWHPGGLFKKLSHYGITGSVYNILLDLYYYYTRSVA